MQSVPTRLRNVHRIGRGTVLEGMGSRGPANPTFSLQFYTAFTQIVSGLGFPFSEHLLSPPTRRHRELVNRDSMDIIFLSLQTKVKSTHPCFGERVHCEFQISLKSRRLGADGFHVRNEPILT